MTELNIAFTEDVGEAAFYGPKLDVQAKNIFGKEDTLITIQLDFAAGTSFGMTYIDADGEKKTPFVIHRSSIGCYERTLAMLIEKYAGAFTTWFAPVQIKLLPVTDRSLDYCKQLLDKFSYKGLRAEIDLRNEKIGRKIRDAQLEKVPYMLIIGDKECEEGTVSVRARGEGDLGAVAVDEFIAKIVEEVENKIIKNA